MEVVEATSYNIFGIVVVCRFIDDGTVLAHSTSTAFCGLCKLPRLAGTESIWVTQVYCITIAITSGVQTSHFLFSWSTSCLLPFCKFWQGSLPKSAKKEETRKASSREKGTYLKPGGWDFRTRKQVWECSWYKTHPITPFNIDRSHLSQKSRAFQHA
jgi:hypothetical protein